MSEEVREAEVVEEATALQKREEAPLSKQARLSVNDVLEQLTAVKELMRRAMDPKEDYGTIPGCGDKPTLKKPGAEKLLLLFDLRPKYSMDERDMGEGHREFVITCDLIHRGTGLWAGQGIGSCSTLENKYRWRNASRVCPECGKETIIKGREEYGGGWLCYGKKGGCGAKWNDGAQEIEGQEVGKVENPDVADQYNTVLKMAQKRALVAAVLNSTGASALFTQDLEDMPNVAPEPQRQPTPAPEEKPKSQQKSRPKTITKAEQNELWKHAMTRAEDTGATREQIMRDILVFLKLEGTADIPADQYDRVKGMIAEWDPELKMDELEPEHAE